MAQFNITIKIELDKPPVGVCFALQEGKGNNFTPVQKQVATGQNMFFTCSMAVKTEDGKPPVFLGPFSQGPADGRFIYIDVGTIAGQLHSPWQRRMKIPLIGISLDTIQQLAQNPALVLATKVPGVGKDGGPNCATIKPFSGWRLEKTPHQS